MTEPHWLISYNYDGLSQIDATTTAFLLSSFDLRSIYTFDWKSKTFHGRSEKLFGSRWLGNCAAIRPTRNDPLMVAVAGQTKTEVQRPILKRNKVRKLQRQVIKASVHL